MSSHGARRFLIGVCGPGESATREDIAMAEEIGEAIARAGWVVMTGGRNVGVMDAASRGAHRASGLAIGILPDRDTTRASQDVDVAIATGLGEARNVVLVQSVDAVVVCGMSAGTASEAALAAQMRKPLVLVRPSAETVAFLDTFARGAYTVASSADAMLVALRASIAQH
jgi:uncharacterized protein (TIGR00725 family)